MRFFFALRLVEALLHSIDFRVYDDRREKKTLCKKYIYRCLFYNFSGANLLHLLLHLMAVIILPRIEFAQKRKREEEEGEKKTFEIR